MTTDSDRAGLLFECGRCGAAPGYNCRTYRGRTRPNGQRATYQHADRYWQVREVLEVSGYLREWNEAQERWRATLRWLNRITPDVSVLAERGQGVNAQWLLTQITELQEVIR